MAEQRESTIDRDHRAAELGAEVRKRRHELGLSVEEASTDAGISRTAWQGIEAGRHLHPRPASLRAVDHALRWRSGTSVALLSGENVELETVIEMKRPAVFLSHSAADRPTRAQLDAYLDALGEADLELLLPLAERLVGASNHEQRIDRLEALFAELTRAT